jgi:hypothetical protein
VSLHGRRGQAIANDEEERSRRRGKAGAVCRTQATAKVGTQQIATAIGRLAVHSNIGEARCSKIGAQSGDIEFRMHRVTRSGMRGLKVEMRRCRQAIARASKRNPRRGEAAQVDPVRWRALLGHAIAVPRLPTRVHWGGWQRRGHHLRTTA